MWWKKNRWKALAAVLILAGLTAAFRFGGEVPANNRDVWEPASVQTETPEAAESLAPAAGQQNPSGQTAAPAPDASHSPSPSLSPEPAEKFRQDNRPQDGTPMVAEAGGRTNPDAASEAPPPAQPTEESAGSEACTCTLSISCAAILDNMDLCDPEKAELVPEDGWILKPVTVTFYDGESVFNVLQRVCKQNAIHLEFENTPIYNSAYIEGIGNLYEFDAGELSGWMYKVGDWFPNYGCSRYQLKQNDSVSWVFTCDQGNDVGGGTAGEGGQRDD